MPPNIEVTDHAVLRYVQRVDLTGCRSSIEERVRDSMPAAQWVYKALGYRNNGKHKWKFGTRLQPQIARRDHESHCVYLIRIVSKDTWQVVTVLSQQQVGALKTAYQVN